MAKGGSGMRDEGKGGRKLKGVRSTYPAFDVLRLNRPYTNTVTYIPRHWSGVFKSKMVTDEVGFRLLPFSLGMSSSDL
jgi:hypothetical protein